MSDEDHKSSWLEPLPEEFVPQGDATTRRMLIAGLTVVVLAIFGGLIWYSYLDGGSSGPVPIIRADNAVVKEKPDSPGGLQVPDQDKRVFNRITSEDSDQGDKLAPSDEIPIDLPEPETALAPETDEEQAVDALAQSGPQSGPQSGDAIKIDTEKETVLESQNAPLTETQVATDMPKKAAEAKIAMPALMPKPGEFLIQLGAFGKKDTAEGLWKALQRDNKALLGTLRSDIMMIDLGKKGVLYRLRGGIIENRPAAEKICEGLKAKKQACIVVAK